MRPNSDSALGLEFTHMKLRVQDRTWDIHIFFVKKYVGVRSFSDLSSRSFFEGIA